MNWDALGAIAEFGGVLAVLVTLVFISRQLRQSNRQVLLGSFQNTFDALNAWCVMISESSDVARLVVSGRESYEGLSNEDRLRFDHIHIHLLNVIESHHFQVEQTSMDDSYREWAIENLEGIAGGYLGFPGTKTFWEGVRTFYPTSVQRLVDRNIGEEG